MLPWEGVASDERRSPASQSPRGGAGRRVLHGAGAQGSRVVPLTRQLRAASEDRLLSASASVLVW